jgi:hypothetical protein
MASNSSEAARHHIILIHGIRTRADWQDMVRDILEGADGRRNPNIQVTSIKYGRFDLIRFLLPGITRKAPIDRTRRKLAIARAQAAATGFPVSIIAHSYGTYSVCKILEDDRSININNLILCGSIVSHNYDWGASKNQIKGKIINDFGVRDIWPCVASSVTWGYGNSGTFGFGDPSIEDRRHLKRHSGFFDRQFVEKYWRSLFWEQKIVRPNYGDGETPVSPAWFELFSIPWRWIFVFTLCLAAYIFADTQYYKPHTAASTNPSVVSQRPKGLYAYYEIDAARNATPVDGGLEALNFARFRQPLYGEISVGQILKASTTKSLRAEPNSAGSETPYPAGNCLKVISKPVWPVPTTKALSGGYLPVEPTDCPSAKPASPKQMPAVLDEPVAAALPAAKRCRPGPYFPTVNLFGGVRAWGATDIEEIIAEYQKCKDMNVELTSYASSENSSGENMIVSEKLANHVKSELVKSGIPAEIISVFIQAEVAISWATNNRVLVKFVPR